MKKRKMDENGEKYDIENFKCERIENIIMNYGINIPIKLRMLYLFNNIINIIKIK